MTKKSVFIIAAVVVIGYFAMVEVNTYLGKKALENTGLEIHQLESAFTLAKTESKLVLVDLAAIWCPNCRKMDETVLSDPKVRQAIQEKFIFARVEYETDEGKAFRERYGISGFPNVLILSPQGDLVKHLPFTLDPEAFLGYLSQ